MTCENNEKYSLNATGQMRKRGKTYRSDITTHETTVHTPQHRKLLSEQHELHQKTNKNSTKTQRKTNCLSKLRSDLWCLNSNIDATM